MVCEPEHVYLEQCVLRPDLKRLGINLPNSHTEVERRVFRRHKAAHHPRLEALEYSLDSPSGKQHSINLSMYYSKKFVYKTRNSESDII